MADDALAAARLETIEECRELLMKVADGYRRYAHQFDRATQLAASEWHLQGADQCIALAGLLADLRDGKPVDVAAYVDAN